MASSIDITVKAIGLEADITKQYNAVQAAINRKPISIKLNATQFPLGRITGDVKEFEKSMNAATSRVIAFGLAAGVFSNISKGFQNFIKSTIDVEDALTRINVNLGQGADGLKRFSAQIFEIARNTGTTFEETAKAAEELARQGLSAEETATRLKNALILARIAGIDTADSVKALTSAVNTFQKEGITTTDVVNRFAAVDTRFAVSSKDLSEAISRVGNSAQEAGVSFNQLLGIVTAVQQSTQRGGATIGNSLKTIFTRISRPEALEQLQDLGIVTKDVQNNLLPGIQIIQNLAAQYDKLSQGQKSFVAEQVGGVYQINILKAAVADLSKEYGTYAQVQKIANDAGDAAIQKNEKLNQTLKSLINSTENSFKELFASLGNQQVGGLFKTLLNELEDFRKALQNTDLGQFIGDSLLRGISNVLTGPALVGIVVALGRTVAKVFQNIGGSLSSALGINTIADQRALIQEKINQLLAKATTAEQQQIATATSLLERKEAILRISERITAQEQVTAFQGAELAGSLLGPRGLTNQGGARVNPKFTLANGYVPAAVLKEQKAILGGVGGASSTAKPVVIPNFAFGNGKMGTVVANTDEYMVKNYAAGADAIFNPSMLKSGGIPNGAKKISNAAEGYVPNYADSFQYGDLRQSSGAPVKKQDIENLNKLFDNIAKAGSVSSAGKFTQQIQDFSKNLNKISETAIFQKLGKTFNDLGEKIKKIEEFNPKRAEDFLSAKKQLGGLPSESDVFGQAKREAAQKKALEIETGFNAIQKSQPISAEISPNQLRQELKSGFQAIDDLNKEISLRARTITAKIVREGGGKLSEANVLAVQAQSFKGTSFQPAFDQGIISRRKKEVDQDRFLSARFERGRTTAIERVFGQKSAGLEVTPGQEKLFQDVLKEEAKRVAAKTLSPNASKGAIQEFVKQFVQSKNVQFEEAARAATKDSSFFGRASKFLNKPSTSIGIAIAAPLAAGFVQEGRGGTTEGVRNGALSGGLQGAGIGGVFGAPGIAIGAVIGSLVGAISKASQSMQEFSDILGKQSETQKKQLDEVETYVNLQREYNDAIKRGANEEANLLSKKLNDTLKNSSPEVIDKINKTGGGNKELSILLDRQAKEFESDERKRKTELAFKSISGVFTGPNDTGVRAAASSLAVRASEKGIDLSERSKEIRNIGGKNSENEKVAAEKRLFKDLDLENEFLDIGKGSRNVLNAITKAAIDQKKVKDGLANLAKIAPLVQQQLQGLPTNAFANKGDLTPFAQSGALSRFSNQFTTKYQKADTRTSFFRTLQSEGAFGEGQEGALKLENTPEFRASRGVSQRGNLLDRIESFLREKIPGLVTRGPNGAFLEGGIQRSLTNLSRANPNDIESKTLLDRLQESNNTIKNLQANNETKNKLNPNQGSLNSLQIGVHTTAFAGTNSAAAQKFLLTTEESKAAQERARNFIKNGGTRGVLAANVAEKESEVKPLIGDAQRKIDNAVAFEAPKQIKTFADSVSEFNKANLTASEKISKALEEATNSFKNTRIEAMNNFAITVQVAPDISEVVTKAAMAEYAKYVESQLRQILGEVKGKPVPPSPVDSRAKGTFQVPTNSFQVGFGLK